MEELKKENFSLEEELNTLQNDSVSKKKSENIAYQIMWLTLFLVLLFMLLPYGWQQSCRWQLIKTDKYRSVTFCRIELINSVRFNNFIQQFTLI